MDSHLFRRLAAELEPLLQGRRIQKLFAPGEDVRTLDLGSGPGGRFLLLHFGSKEPLLFLAQEKPRNPEHPDAGIMWLRKRLLGRRLRQQHCDWFGRRLAWELSGLEGGLLVLCLKQGLGLREQLPEDWPSAETLAQPWPPLDLVLRTLDGPEAQSAELWRRSPQLSPALRRVLPQLPPEGAAALYRGLQSGTAGACYLYQRGEGDSAPEVLPWPLPESLRQGRELSVQATALEALAQAGAMRLYAALAKEETGPEREALKRAQKRLKRTLAKLEQEAARLQALVTLRPKGLAIQASLWNLDGGRKLHRLTLPAPDGEGELCLDLDPALTVAENMARFFRLAAKGERGLPLVNARRQALEEELAALRPGQLSARDLRRQTQLEEQRGESRTGKVRKEAKEHDPSLQRFRTSDGFLLLRGRNKAANHKLVSRVAAPFDLWFHAQDGPGAHLILKRDHPKQEPPRQSLLEAATLAGLKGWQSRDAKARVICALVKDVRTIKGADLGRVAVDKILEAFLVPLDPELETRLREE